ncbi:MAG: pilus assembly protein N-terminal domain-containing protein, partial [Candidatus Eremiobacteraeota bacterium]|nr:pilus assembly protein N-terminal domain-containing protein [Candidatus Eremiobacteraeota bacterium]
QEAPSPAPSASPTPSPSPAPTASPTPPPIVVLPQAGAVPVGEKQVLQISSVLGDVTLAVADPSIVDAAVDQDARTLTLTGKSPGATTVTVKDARGLTKDVPVRVAFLAGTIAKEASLQLTGDPASADYVKMQAVALAKRLASARTGAQIVATADQVRYASSLAPDNVVNIDIPMLVQGTGYFETDGTTRVRVENVAAPRIAPDTLMVSDYPERLEENGVLFTADLAHETPSRFLYFHYNPAGQPDRRIVLRAENPSPEPAVVQFISGAGGPGANEMEVGHDATKRFLVRAVQNEGSLISIPGNGSVNLVEQDAPANAVVANLLQLRVLSGGNVHLTLFAQNAATDPDESLASTELLESAHKHARGIYDIPEFQDARAWSITDPYLELSIGQIPLPNRLKGEALSGDYGVLQSFVVNVMNPYSTPQAIAIYENPRGGRATGTYLIDGVLIQSHQVTAYSRYKIRQYVVPAKGFVRVTIVTMPEGGSFYPLKLIFAPDDGSVAPGAPGSPIY